MHASPVPRPRSPAPPRPRARPGGPRTDAPEAERRTPRYLDRTGSPEVGAALRASRLAQEGEASAEGLPPGLIDSSVIDAELSEVTASPGIEAERAPGRPTVLQPPAAARAALVAEAPAASAHGSAVAPADPATELPEATPEGGTTDEAPAEDVPNPEAVPELMATEETAETTEAEAEAVPTVPATLDEAVPPPQPEALRAHVPERALTEDEFIAVFESTQTPEQDLAQAGQWLAELRAESEATKAVILADAQLQKDTVLAAAAAEAEAVRGAAAGAIAGVRSRGAAARSALAAQLQAKKGALAEQVAGQVARVDAASAAKMELAQAQLDERQSRIAASAESEQASPGELAQVEAQRATAALESAAAECDAAGAAEAAKHPGADDGNPDQRAAAREVGSESAQDIRAKKVDLAEDIRSRSDDASTRYGEYAQSVSDQIDMARADLLPSLVEFAAQAMASLQASAQGVSDSLDQRHATDLAALQSSEDSAVGQVAQARQASLARIDVEAQAACAGIDTQAGILAANIDVALQETEAVVMSGGEVFLPGVLDVIASARLGLQTATGEGRAALAATAQASLGALGQETQGLAAQVAQVLGGMAAGTRSLVAAADAAGDGIVQGQATQGEQTAEAVALQQDGLIEPVMAQIDEALDEAEAAMTDLTTEFATGLEAGVDESIEQAILPRTDDVETRVEEAADQADDAWYEGLARAVGQIVIGLVIMVAVALVVAAIAAAFGVIITAWTAVMIAGAILLVVGFVLALRARSQQEQLADAPWYEVAAIALGDTVGYVGIHEAASGHDFVTGDRLTEGERTERGTMGVVTMVSLALGVRGAIKGPPGGAFVRPSALPRGLFGWRPGAGGFVGLRGAMGQMGRGMRAVGVEMWAGTRGGASSAVEWVRTRVLRMEPTRPAPELLARVGEPSTAETIRPNELPYRLPPEVYVAERGRPIDVSRLDPNQRYLWVVDPEGRVIIAPETQPGFGRTVKHGDLVPGGGGEFRGSARAGGELNARLNRATGEYVWEMDSDSSYSFARTDQGVLTEPSRAAAHDVLTETGTNTENIDVLVKPRNPNSPTRHTPAAPRPGGAPGVVPARLPPDTSPRAREEGAVVVP
ncbi:hypothetical protein [Hydrogenophaga sp.]|uniref:hypothetical protein n=1 Tax=Hydrogenophaga sp. TaxID=1904254 RepID=UPI0025BD2DE3|nr:hypothetical protein [Hydrogenophaga sp.]MBT9464996.1 hypothetical protein [Hydrogenophaga sp.]